MPIDSVSYLNQFLTWKPFYIALLRDQWDFIYFCSNRDTAVTCMMKVEIYYSDETTYTYNRYSGTVLQPRTIHCFPCGYAQLGIGDFDTPEVPKTVVAWTIQLLVDGDTDTISELRLYYLSRKYLGTTKQFVFANSLGGYDTVIFYGDHLTEQELTSMQLIRRVDPITYTHTTPQRNNRQRKEQLTFKASSGHIERKTLDWLRELTLSEEVYVIEKNHYGIQYMLPVEITSQKVKLVDEGNHLYSMNIDYKHLFTNSSYTPIVNIIT